MKERESELEIEKERERVGKRRERESGCREGRERDERKKVNKQSMGKKVKTKSKK